MKTPNFSLPDQTGRIHTLDDYKGRWLVIYFYPEDGTPACTKEACAFRDAYQELQNLNVSILGISPDTVASHNKFSTNHSLNFPILSDPDHTVATHFGAWGMKKMMGREFIATHRNTYIINPEGEIVKEYKDIRTDTHIPAVLNDINRLIV